MKKLFSRFGKVVSIALMIGVFTVSSAVPASASAGGYAYWGGFSANIGGQSIRIPSGQLYHYISGSGFKVNWDGANYASTAPLCDTAVRFTYGNGAYELWGNTHWGCSMGNQWKYDLGGWIAPRGDACAELWAKNRQVKIVKQCHYITG